MLNLKFARGLETIPGDPLLQSMESDSVGLAKALIEATPHQRGTGDGQQPNARQVAVYQRIQEAFRDPDGYSKLLIDAADQLPREGRTDYDGDVIAYLIAKGADVDYRGEMGKAALHYAHSATIVGLLFAKGATVDLRDDEGQTPLHFHAGTNASSVVRALLRYGANPNTVDNSGASVLSTAIDNARGDAASILLDYGADPTLGNASVAFLNLLEGDKNIDSYFSFVQRMFERGITFQQGTLTDLLATMVGRGYVRTAKLLIEKGANVNVLHTAALGDDPDAIQPMIDYLLNL